MYFNFRKKGNLIWLTYATCVAPRKPPSMVVLSVRFLTNICFTFSCVCEQWLSMAIIIESFRKMAPGRLCHILGMYVFVINSFFIDPLIETASLTLSGKLSFGMFLRFSMIVTGSLHRDSLDSIEVQRSIRRHVKIQRHLQYVKKWKSGN